MGKVLAGITISVDGFITGPSDGPGCGLGVGGERLHYWVSGGPWSYGSPGAGSRPSGQGMAGATTGANGAVIAGRGTYEAAGHWGGKNPWGIPVFVVTHRPERCSASPTTSSARSAPTFLYGRRMYETLPVWPHRSQGGTSPRAASMGS